jgi:Domain of unknown function (DUF4280)
LPGEGGVMALAACAGARLRCSCGSSGSRFAVLPVHRFSVGRQAVATILDSKPGVNILPFGECASARNPVVLAAGGEPRPCVPAIRGLWIPGGGGVVTVGGVPWLTDSAKLHCAWAGVIQFERAGQFTCRGA